MQTGTAFPEIKKFLNIGDVCGVLDIAPQTLYKMIQRNKGPRTTRIGRLIRIHPDDFRSWLENPNRTQPRRKK